MHGEVLGSSIYSFFLIKYDGWLYQMSLKDLQKIPHASFWSSIADFKFSRVSRMVHSVEYPFGKPNWKLKRRHFRYETSWSYKLVIQKFFQYCTESGNNDSYWSVISWLRYTTTFKNYDHRNHHDYRSYQRFATTMIIHCDYRQHRNKPEYRNNQSSLSMCCCQGPGFFKQFRPG